MKWLVLDVVTCVYCGELRCDQLAMIGRNTNMND